MLSRSHATMTSFKRSPSRRRSPRFLDKSTSLPQHWGNYSEKYGECGTSPDIADKSGGHRVSGGGLRKSPRLNGKIEPDNVCDVPSRTSNQVGGGESVARCSSGNGRRKSPQLNGKVRTDGSSDVKKGNIDKEDRYKSIGYGVSGSGLRKSARLSSNINPGGASNMPSLNCSLEEQGGSGRCGISGVVARKSPRLNGGNDSSKVSDVFCRYGDSRDRGIPGGCGNLDIVVRRSPRLIRCAKPLNSNDGCDPTLSKVLVNKVVHDVSQYCGDALAETNSDSRQCVLGLTCLFAMNKKREEHIQVSKRTMIENPTCDHSHEEWTSEQLAALQRAYLLAKPTPHFWKNVSKLVPGKSAKECFDKIHSEHLTPPQTRLRTRVPRTDTFVEDECRLSASKILKSHKPLVKNPTKKKKIHLAHKTVRQLMKKQSSLSRNHEADFFSILELNQGSSPQVPGTLLSTPENLPRTGGLLKRFQEESSSGRKKPLSRFCSSTGTDLVSPPVLKQVKNMALHEKYLDHLHNRDAKRRKLEPPGRGNKVKVDENVDVVEAAKSALILDAKDAIKQFQLTAGYNRSPFMESEDDRFEIKGDDEEIGMLSDTHQH